MFAGWIAEDDAEDAAAVVEEDSGVVRSAVATADQHTDDFVRCSAAVGLHKAFG